MAQVITLKDTQNLAARTAHNAYVPQVQERSSREIIEQRSRAAHIFTEVEKPLLVRLPKQQNDVAPGGVVALRSLTLSSNGARLNRENYDVQAAMAKQSKSVSAYMDWIEAMPGNWCDEASFSPLFDIRDGHCIFGVHIKNIILFSSALHGLEAKLGMPLMAKAMDGARLAVPEAMRHIAEHHSADYRPYNPVIAGPW